MKSKKAIKLIKYVCDLLKLAIELEKKQAERLANTPIPDYKKGAKDSLFVCGDGKKEETVLSAEQWSNSLKMAMRGKGITFSEAFEKAKAEDPVLKEAYDEIDKSLKPVLKVPAFALSKFKQKWNEAMDQAKKAK